MGYTTKYNSYEGPDYYDAGFQAWWEARIAEYEAGAAGGDARLKRLFKGRISQAKRELEKGLEFRAKRNLD